MSSETGQVVTVHASHLHKALRAVTLSMSKDSTRPHINGALFEQHGGGLAIVCTDGRRLSRYIVECEGSHDPFMLSAESIKGVMRDLSGELSGDAAQPFTFTKRKLRITTKIGSVSRFHSEVQETFPPWAKVLPPLEKCRRVPFAMLNPEYVKQAAAAAKILAPKDAMVFMCAESDVGAVQVACGDTGWRMAIMPMRGNRFERDVEDAMVFGLKGGEK